MLTRARAVHDAMITGGWVCALHVRTAGLGGAALGSDEEEVVYLAYVVIDVLSNQVRMGKIWCVKMLISSMRPMRVNWFVVRYLFRGSVGRLIYLDS